MACFNNSSKILLILIYILATLCIFYIVLILYFRKGWQNLKSFPPGGKDGGVFISVIISARNEEKNLPALLKDLSNQKYNRRNFEVIVVDDHSEDNTAEIVKSFDWVKLISLSNYVSEKINSYKKIAIEIAISQSKGELIVTTDADCRVNYLWLSTIASFAEVSKAKMIIMPVSYNYNPTFLGLFQILDFMSLQGITASSVELKNPLMCNGANLAYRKTAFEEVNGFNGTNKLASGDDMFLLHKIADKFPESISYLKSNDVIVHTDAMPSLNSFLNQRIRWAGKSKSYKNFKIKLVLLFVYLFNILLFITPILALIKPLTLTVSSSKILSAWLFILLLKTIAEMWFLKPVSKFFKYGNIMGFFPLAQPFHIIYTVISGTLGFKSTYKWKGRIVK